MTLTIMGTIITAATIMAMYLNSTGNQNSQYYYNADVENGQVKTMYVYEKQGETLNGKMEYRYTYDELGRVTTKTVYKGNAADSSLTPTCRYDYTYTAGGYNLEHRAWIDSRGAFAPADSRTEYRMETNCVVSVANYVLNEDTSEMTLVNDMLAIVPAETEMAAGF